MAGDTYLNGKVYLYGRRGSVNLLTYLGPMPPYGLLDRRSEERGLLMNMAAAKVPPAQTDGALSHTSSTTKHASLWDDAST